MKIGIIGNMNNSYFALARYLRDEGYDCELLILTNEPDHFDPSCDTFSTGYRAYCRHVSWGDPADFLKQDFSQVKRDLAPYDFLIGNGPAPAYANRINRRLDVFMPYGYDLYSLPFLRLVHPRRQMAYVSVSIRQRRGIRQSRFVLFDRTNAAFEKRIAALGYKGTRIVSPAPMIYHRDYENGWREQLHFDPLLQKVAGWRAGADVLLVQHGRQLWKQSDDEWSYKGNHHLIEGYAAFLKNFPHVRSKLILLEYGNDVDETKKLIARLGIAGRVEWLPKMARNKLMAVLAQADMIVGELHHSWLSYGVALEALCLAKPFVHKRLDAEFAADYPELYPMFHAHSADSVCAALAKLVTDRALVQSVGEGGREWFLTYCVARPLNQLKKIIEQKKQAAHA